MAEVIQKRHYLTASDQVQIISVKYNNLTGTLPASLGSLTDLTEVMIQNNNFRFDCLLATCYKGQA